MTRCAGLEIDAQILRLAIFEVVRGEPQLVDFVEAALPAEPTEERGEAVREILAKTLARKENQGIEFVTCLDARQVILREISVQYLKDDLIAKTIRFEAESYLHGQAIEDVVVEYLKSGETAESSRLILCVVLKPALARHLEILRKAGVDPREIELDATALASAFAITPLYTGEQNVLLVEIEDTFERFVFMERDRVAKVRSVWERQAIQRPDRLLGEAALAANGSASEGASKDSSIEKTFEEIERSLSALDRETLRAADAADAAGDLEEGGVPLAVVAEEDYARLAKARPAPGGGTALKAVPAAAPALARGSDPMTRLILEIERTFAAYVLRNAIDLIVVTGSRAASMNAVKRLSEHFEVETVPFAFGDAFPISWDGDREVLDSRGAVACGLGLRAAGKGFTSFDLRKDEFRFERRFEQLMPALTLVGLLLWALALVWSFGLFLDKRRVTAEIGEIIERQTEIYSSFFGEAPQEGAKTTPAQQAKVKLGQFKGVKSSQIKQYLNPNEMLADFLQAVKRARVDNKEIYPSYSNFDLSPELNKNAKTSVKLRVKTQSEATAIEDALRTHCKLFANPKVTTTTNKNAGDFTVTIDLRVDQKIIDQRKK